MTIEERVTYLENVSNSILKNQIAATESFKGLVLENSAAFVNVKTDIVALADCLASIPMGEEAGRKISCIVARMQTALERAEAKLADIKKKHGGNPPAPPGI